MLTSAVWAVYRCNLCSVRVRNRFKAKLEADDRQIGYWLSLASPLATEAISKVGFDWALIDTEHSPTEIAGLVPLLQAAGNGTAHPIVRPAWNDAVLIKRILDVGAQTLLIPFVQTGEEARRAVAATRYPPNGVRGVAGATRASNFGLDRSYLKEANDSICCIVQIETSVAVGNVVEIAETPGVDAVFFGPSDLAASLGHLGDPEAKLVQHTLKENIGRLARRGVKVGVMATNPDVAQRYLEYGARFVSVGVDVTGLVANASEGLSKSKKLLGVV